MKSAILPRSVIVWSRWESVSEIHQSTHNHQRGDAYKISRASIVVLRKRRRRMLPRQVRWSGSRCYFYQYHPSCGASSSRHRPISSSSRHRPISSSSRHRPISSSSIRHSHPQRRPREVWVHNGLLSPSLTVPIKKMDYIRGWAWQTVLLQQRLHYKRHHQQQQQQQSIVQTEDIDDDETTKQPQRQPPLPPPPNVVLLLEHEPVYTLGRGATVDHVTGLFRSLPPIKAAAACPDDSTTTTTTTDRYDSFRRRLDRQYRGADAARLTAPPSTDNWFARRDDDDNGTSHQNLNDNIDNTEEVRRLFSEATVAQELLVRHIQTQQHELAQASIPPVVVPPSPSILSYSKNEGYGVPIYRVERGGEVTFHGPGQLIVYPIWDLTSDPAIFQSDLHWYLRCLEQAVIDAVTELLLQQQQKSQTDKEQRQQHEDMERFVESSSPPSLPQVHRDENHTGVWINQRDKIAAVGVASSRWITSHGIALNVTTDLSFFDPEVIVPCGIPSSLVLSDDTDDDNNRNSRGVTSLEKLGVEASVPEVAAILLKHMARIFNVDFVTGDPIQ